MIRVLVYENPNNPEVHDIPEPVIFNFENFNNDDCQNLIEVCLKNNKLIKIYNFEEYKWTDGLNCIEK